MFQSPLTMVNFFLPFFHLYEVETQKPCQQSESPRTVVHKGLWNKGKCLQGLVWSGGGGPAPMAPQWCTTAGTLGLLTVPGGYTVLEGLGGSQSPLWASPLGEITPIRDQSILSVLDQKPEVCSYCKWGQLEAMGQRGLQVSQTLLEASISSQALLKAAGCTTTVVLPVSRPLPLKANSLFPAPNGESQSTTLGSAALEPRNNLKKGSYINSEWASCINLGSVWNLDNLQKVPSLSNKHHKLMASFPRILQMTMSTFWKWVKHLFICKGNRTAAYQR